MHYVDTIHESKALTRGVFAVKLTPTIAAVLAWWHLYAEEQHTSYSNAYMFMYITRQARISKAYDAYIRSKQFLDRYDTDFVRL